MMHGMDVTRTIDLTTRRVLVTGAAGFVGSHIVEAALADGHEVVGIDAFIDSYDRSLKERNLTGVLGHPRFRFGEVDLRYDDLAPWVDGVDAVINEAALAGLPRSWTDVETYVTCNLLGLARLIDACQAAGTARFVQASTSSVYGLEAVGDEEQPTRPVSPYGVSKLAAEHLLMAHVHATGFPATILRYFSIYGPRQRPDMAYHRFIEACRRDGRIVVYGDGRQARSNTYVSDVVAGTLAAVDAGKVGEVYNIGGGQLLELHRAIDLIADAVGVRPLVTHVSARRGDQRCTWADTSKAYDDLGFQPRIGPAEGLRRQVAWHREVLPAPDAVDVSVAAEPTRPMVSTAPGGD
jgi:nucleoside-diphosphate-sugar epimerase